MTAPMSVDYPVQNAQNCQDFEKGDPKIKRIQLKGETENVNACV
jgi:hypothetical protein